VEFPPNSQSPRAKTADEIMPEIKPEAVRITTNKVVQRKKPLGSRIKEMFVGGDARSVGQYLLQDVFVPAARDMIADMVSQGAERMIFGEARSTPRRGARGPVGGNNGYVSYNRFSSGAAQRDSARPFSQRSRASHNFDEICLETRVEADEVIDALFTLIQKYEWVSVADLYSIVGITAKFTDQNWGWKDLRGLGATRVSDGYLLNIPRPEPRD
jgi:hypothetical protein